MALYGAPLGPGHEAGYRYVNEAWTPSLLLSVLVRNVGLHLVGSSDYYNAVFGWVIREIHAALGVALNDPRTTWMPELYGFFSTSGDYDENHEGNPFHLLLLILGVGALLFSPRLRATANLAPYALCLAAGFLLFVAVLKWQPNHSRLQLPLFVLWAPVLALSLGQRARMQVMNCMFAFLLLMALPVLLFNRDRPIFGEPNIIDGQPLDLQLIRRPSLIPGYKGAVKLLDQHHCRAIGLTITWDSPEYPLWALLSTGGKSFRLEHMGVTNESARLASLEHFATYKPCGQISVLGSYVTASVTEAAEEPSR
jgi:hypothetical protein